MMCAAVWRNTCLPSSSAKVRSDTSASESMTVESSVSTPLTLATRTSREILPAAFAASNTDTGASLSYTLPSENLILNIKNTFFLIGNTDPFRKFNKTM